jgi:tetratricopeptide (TPR) repeat protein
LAAISAGSVFGLALAAPILSWGYLKAGRRKMTIGFVIFLALLPFIVEMAGRASATQNSRLYSATHSYLSGNWEPESVKTLIKAGNKKPDDTELWFSLANLYRRAGDSKRSQKFIDRVLAKDGNHVKAINEMANLRFQNKEFKEAKLLYKKALKIDSDNAELHYNISKIYLELFKTDKAATEFNIAMQIDKEKTESFVKQANDNKTIKVVSFIADLKSIPLMEKEIGDAAKVEADHIWSTAAGNIGRNSYLAGAAGYLLLLAAVSGIWRRADLSTLCSSCGDTFLPAIRSPGQEEYRCNPCVVLSSTRKRVDKTKKGKKLGQIKDYHFNIRRKGNLLNFLLPGLGHVYYQNYRSGIIFLSITSVFIVKIGFILSPLLAEYGSALKVPLVEYIVWGAAMALFYLMSALLLRRSA